MPRIQTLRECDRNTWFNKNSAVDTPAPHYPCGHGSEEFGKTKKAFESKSSGSRTKEDVDTFNKAVKDINGAVNVYNQTNSKLNNNRDQMLKNWENDEKKFADAHMPYYR